MSKKTVSPSDILNDLKTDTLQDLFLHDRKEEVEGTMKKPGLVRRIAKDIEDAGVKNLVANIKRDELKAILDKVNPEGAEKEKAPTKQVLARRLQKELADSSIEDFLKDNAETEQLKSICESLDLEPKSDKKEELVNQIGNAVRQIGMETYFSSMDVDSLHDICEDLKLKNTNSTNNKRKLVECIINKQDAEKGASPHKKQKPSFSKKKKPIQKGITYEDIFQHYYVDEVRDYCRSNNLKTSGKKAALIKRILAFLEGDTESTTAKPKTKKSNDEEKTEKKDKKDKEEKAEKKDKKAKDKKNNEEKAEKKDKKAKDTKE